MSERFEDILAARRKKLEEIKKAGINPYPSLVSRTHTNKQAVDDFESLANTEITLVGRIRSWRDMGKITFSQIEDGTGKIQILFKEEAIGTQTYKFIIDNSDIGDFIEVTGTLFKTKTGEKTLSVGAGLARPSNDDRAASASAEATADRKASPYKILAKSLRPLPDQHYGLADEETKLRKRYLDILMDPAVKEIFIKKNRFWSFVREFLVKKGFLELEMPVLEAVPGGAEAEPFITHHNALDRDFYLRISLELPLKKMLVAGYEKVFEIGRIFRNEGIDTEHLQDYTQLEFYWAYAGFEDLMKFLQEMYQYVIKETFGTLQMTNHGVTCDWSGDWERISYVKLFKEKTGLDILTASDAELKKFIELNKINHKSDIGRARLIDTIFKWIRPGIPTHKPVFLIEQPVELEPLAKRDSNNPKIVQRVQILAYGTELGKGFGELNDPVDQRLRFDEQMKLREAGDNEAQILDEDYVEAMEYGMPPAAGFGISERLFSVLMDKSIRETVIFPPMKEMSGAPIKSKETKKRSGQINREF